MIRKLILGLLLLASAEAARCGAPASPVRLNSDGCFRLSSGKVFVPLGGFHGNEIPLSMITLSAAERRRVEPFLWDAQKTDGLGHIDLFDASDDMLHHWFRTLAERGVTAVRLFPRARIGVNVLDLCGEPNPDLQAVFERAFRAARPYGIRFLLQIIPEPNLSRYLNPDSLIATCCRGSGRRTSPASRRRRSASSLIAGR